MMKAMSPKNQKKNKSAFHTCSEFKVSHYMYYNTWITLQIFRNKNDLLMTSEVIISCTPIIFVWIITTNEWTDVTSG